MTLTTATKKVCGTIGGFALPAALALAFVLALALASPAHAATITVDSLDDVAPVTDGNCTLREAITNANKDDQSGSIDCAAGSGSDLIRVGVTGTVQLDGALPELSGNLQIEGPGADRFTVRRDTGGVYRIFTVTSGSVVSISGITISGGNAPNSSGGGIFNDGGDLTISGSTISGNFAIAGGGIHNREGILTVTGSTISGNSAGLGGGVFSDTFLSSTQKTTITNSTISGNTATDTGGGVHNFAGLSVIEHSTITNNTAPSGMGSGVASYGQSDTRTEVLSTIISANQGTDVDFTDGTTNSFDSKGYNLIGDGNATAAFNKTGDQIVSDPKLGALADNGGPTETHALLPASPAIDQGKAFGTTTDQRGKLRPFDLANVDNAPGGDGSDIGAFELNNRPPTALADSYTTNEDTARKITLSATDSDNDAVTYKVTSLPTNATLYVGDATDPANQTEANKVVVNTPLPGSEVTYVPNANYNTSANSDTFSFLANDGTADSAEATVSVTVTAVNDSPTVSVLAGSASQSACLSNTSGRLTLKLSDVDSNLSDLKLSSTTTNTSTKSPLVPNSNVSFGGTGGTRTATISMVPGRTGTSTVTVTATDDKLAGGSVDVGVKAGGNGNDTLSGTSGADLLLGQNGDDRLSASGGNDVLCGANGNDRLSGGAGSDTFDGGSGTDAATDYNAAAGDSRTNIP